MNVRFMLALLVSSDNRLRIADPVRPEALATLVSTDETSNVPQRSMNLRSSLVVRFRTENVLAFAGVEADPR